MSGSLAMTGRHIALASNYLLSGRSLRAAAKLNGSEEIDSRSHEALNQFARLLEDAANAATQRAKGTYVPPEPTMLASLKIADAIGRQRTNGRQRSDGYDGLAKLLTRAGALCRAAAEGRITTREVEELVGKLSQIDRAMQRAVESISRSATLV